MKALKVAVLAGAALISLNVHAQSASTSASSTTSASGQGGAVVFAPVSGDVITRYAASSAVAPQLVAGIDTCMGSSSLGGSATTFSFSVGTTWKDQDCRRVKDARELWNMGEHTAALALQCTDDDTRYAIAVSGGLPVQRQDGAILHISCPMSKEEWIAKGKPLLDPTTGQPYTTAQLNPPVRVAQLPNAAQAAAAFDKLPADAKLAVIAQVKAEEIEQRAASIKVADQGAALASPK